MKKLIIIDMLFLLLLATPALGQPVPVTLDDQSHVYSVPIIKADQVLNMPQNKVSYWSFIPPGIQLSECTLRVHFSYSNTLIDHLSTLTVSINGIPVETKGIYEVNTLAEGWWDVKIPLANITTDAVNEISFESKQRSIEGECADIDNPNNWVVLHEDSSLQIGVKEYPSSVLATFYSLYYDGMIDQNVLSTDFIVSPEHSVASNASLLKLASAIGSAYPYKTSLDYAIYTQPPTEANNNRVYIGLLSAWFGNPELKLPESTLEPDQGFLSMIGPAEGKNQYNTLITGDTEVGLNKAVNFIANDVLLKQADKDFLYLNSSPITSPHTFSSNIAGVYTFSDFGYEDIRLAGAFHRSTNLSFIQPQGMQSRKGSHLNIYFTHAETLISDRSILTVSINGIPINSVKLSLSNAEGGKLKVLIPEEALALPIIEVSIDAYHYLGLIDCDKDYYESAWTVIDADSELVMIPEDTMLQPVLRSFPYFYPPVDDRKVAIALIADKSEPMDMAAVLLATRAGQNGGQSYNWQLWQSGTEPTNYSDLDMIFLGSYQDIKLPDKIKDNLAVAPGGDGELKFKEGIELIPETLHNKVLLQVIRSPWDPIRRVYVILYEQEDNLALLNAVLSDNSLLQTLDGQIALLDSRLSIQSQSVIEKIHTPVPMTLEKQLYRWEQFTNMPWWVSAILVVLVVILLIVLWHLRKVKNEFKKAGQNMKAEQGFEATEEQIINEEQDEAKPTEQADVRSEDLGNIIAAEQIILEPESPNTLPAINNDAKEMQNGGEAAAQIKLEPESPNTLPVIYYDAKEMQNGGEAVAQMKFEPESPNTLPAIYYDAKEIQNGGENIVAVLPSDYLIRDENQFVQTIKDRERLAEQYLMTDGISPSEPDTRYGYIKPAVPWDVGYMVAEFKEKTDYEAALNYYLSQGYHWNSSMFMFRTNILSKAIKPYSQKAEEAFQLTVYEEIFAAVPNISIDYGVMEESKRVATIPLDIQWTDLGSLDTYYDEFERDGTGNVIYNKKDTIIESANNLLYTDDNKTVALLGVSDLIVVDDKDALLVCKKDQSQKVKSIVDILKAKDDISEESPSVTYEPWGYYTVLKESHFYKIKRIVVSPGKKLSLQIHYHRSEHWVVVKGVAKVRLEEQETLVRSGESIYVQTGFEHCLENPGKVPLEVIEVQVGEYLDEDDIIILEDN